jgi:hypothetical protein
MPFMNHAVRLFREPEHGTMAQYERGNATGQMAEMACIGCPGDFRTYWFRADAGSFISERR